MEKLAEKPKVAVAPAARRRARTASCAQKTEVVSIDLLSRSWWRSAITILVFCSKRICRLQTFCQRWPWRLLPAAAPAPLPANRRMQEAVQERAAGKGCRKIGNLIARLMNKPMVAVAHAPRLHRFLQANRWAQLEGQDLCRSCWTSPVTLEANA